MNSQNCPLLQFWHFASWQLCLSASWWGKKIGGQSLFWYVWPPWSNP